MRARSWKGERHEDTEGERGRQKRTERKNEGAVRRESTHRSCERRRLCVLASAIDGFEIADLR
eukprot:6181105-Pleurochrysis_carterae.AAC.1